MKSNIFSSSKVIFVDGGMGTILQEKGLETGASPEDWNIASPTVIQDVHRAYFNAGSDIVLTNTFGANRLKYHGANRLEDIIAAAIDNAKNARPASRPAAVALDVGPSGRLLAPAGDCSFDEAYDAFAEQVALGAKHGADAIVIETITDNYELKAAVLAAKENCDLPVVASVALQQDGKLLTGGNIESIAALLNGLRVDAIGLNCGFGPDMMLEYVRQLAKLTTLPIMAKPNAGLPKVIDGETRFLVGPEEFARDLVALVDAGATIIGGCCGTTPAHIAAAHEALKGRECAIRFIDGEKSFISSGTRALELPFDDTLIVGERINPTGKKKLKEAYSNGDYGYILREAVAQIEAGAHVLDVNAGVPGIDEKLVLTETVEKVQAVTDVPLQIDTSNLSALESAMRHYNGKPLVNSVNGNEDVMNGVFPIVAKYGGMVVALTLDEKGIPPTAGGRLEIAKRILKRGEEYGLTRNDFVIDVLCMTVSAEPESANVVLESLRRVRNELGCRTILGVSNISFGLPSRPLVNAFFYEMALAAGLTTAIINPLSNEMTAAYHAYRALTGKDKSCSEWIAKSQQGVLTLQSAANGVPVQSSHSAAKAGMASDMPPLQYAIVKGLKEDAASIAASELAAGRKPVELIDGSIVPALDIVGKSFETGKMFLPQLLMSAEASSAAFEVIKKVLEKANVKSEAKGPVIMATVKGDVHDIGKNIVRALLENYGFKVIDLGRDVAPETIVECAIQNKCRIVGLSALMTTTVGFMEETIKQLKAADPGIKTLVGGAVLTQEYADEIGATWYAKDAMASVRICEKFFAGEKD